MLRKMYSVYDRKAEMFSQPQFYVTDGEAVRAFVAVCGDNDTMMGRFPADYELFYVGDWADHSGLVSAPPKGARSLCTAVEARHRALHGVTDEEAQ